MDEAWKSWKDLQDSPEMDALIKVANDKLSAAAEGKGKGKGKGDESPQ